MPLNSNWYAPKLNGIPFIALESSLPQLGRKTVIFEYPNSDSRYVEDMGKYRSVYSLTAQITANNLTPSSYKRNKKRFEKALSHEGLGVLIHPTLGRKEVVIVRAEQIEPVQNQIGQCIYKFVCAESDLNKFPTQLENKKSLLNKLDDLIKQKLGFGIENMIDGLDSALESYNSVRDGITAVCDAMQQAMETINGINDEIAGLTADITNLKNSINDVLKFPSKFATSFVANLGRLIQVTSNFSDAFNLQEKVFRNTIAPFESLLNEVKVSNTISSTTKVALLSNSFIIATAIDYKDQSEINNIVKKLEAMYSSINPIFLTDEIYTLVQNIRYQTLLDLKNLKLKLPYVNSINTNQLPAIALAYNLYNQSARGQYENILNLNKVQDPSNLNGDIKIFTT